MLRSIGENNPAIRESFERFIWANIHLSKSNNKATLLLFPLAFDMFDRASSSEFAIFCDDKRSGADDQVKKQFRTLMRRRFHPAQGKVVSEAIEVVFSQYKYINSQCLKFIDYALKHLGKKLWKYVKEFIPLLHYLKADTEDEVFNVLKHIEYLAKPYQQALGDSTFELSNLGVEI